MFHSHLTFSHDRVINFYIVCVHQKSALLNPPYPGSG